MAHWQEAERALPSHSEPSTAIVSDDPIEAFGDALLWTLERQFGSAFTPELRQAWAALYAAVLSDMLPELEGTGVMSPNHPSEHGS
jgi:hemoglobin-like flavoprotein